MGKISGKSLADKYDDFLEPCVQVITSAGEISSEDGIYLEKAEVISSVGMDPDMAVLVYQADKFSGRDFAEMEKYMDVGQKIEVKTGYGDNLSRVFQGYLHQVEAEDSMQEYVEYTLICLDVKGLMKKNSVFQVSGAKKVQQIINDILNADCYKEFVKEKKVDPLPEKLNQDCIIKGETHYDWLCGLASYLDYEFFCGMGNVIFRKARQSGNDVLELSEEYGLQRVRIMVSMAGQIGSVQVCGYNRKDEKISGTADWPGVAGAFTKKLKKALSGHTLIYLDRELESRDEAEKCAKAMMNRMAGRCARMEAVNIGLPELRPGICAEIVSDDVESLAGRIYVEETRHLLDEEGYRTIVTGTLLA